MREMVDSFRSLSPVPKVLVGGTLLIAGIVLLLNVPNVLAVLFVIVAVVAVVGFLSLPFIALAIGAYTMARAFHRRIQRQAPAIPGQPATAPARATSPAPAPGSFVAQYARARELTTSDLPPEIGGMVARICDKTAALRSPDQSGLLTVEDREHVERTLDEYLVHVLATYRALPKGSEQWQVEPEGETAIQLVLRQLHLLEESLDRIAQRVFQAGAAQLTAQQRFLEERLGERSPHDLGLPPPPPA